MLSARILRAHRICKIAHFALQFGRFYFPKSAILQTNFAHFARIRIIDIRLLANGLNIRNKVIEELKNLYNALN